MVRARQVKGLEFGELAASPDPETPKEETVPPDPAQARPRRAADFDAPDIATRPFTQKRSTPSCRRHRPRSLKRRSAADDAAYPLFRFTYISGLLRAGCGFFTPTRSWRVFRRRSSERAACFVRRWKRRTARPTGPSRISGDFVALKEFLLRRSRAANCARGCLSIGAFACGRTARPCLCCGGDAAKSSSAWRRGKRPMSIAACSRFWESGSSRPSSGAVRRGDCPPCCSVSCSCSSCSPCSARGLRSIRTLNIRSVRFWALSRRAAASWWGP